MLRATGSRVRAAACGSLVLGSVLVGTAMAGIAAAAGSQRIEIADDCEPVTFNLGGRVLFGATNDLCDPRFAGNTTIGRFLDELIQKHQVGAWRFQPDHVDVDAGTRIDLVRRGGEAHTFTEVTATGFGGGFVPPLNQLGQFGGTVSECNPATLSPVAPPPGTPINLILPPGGSATLTTGPNSNVPAGTHLFQCCIHPWMRTAVTVRPR